MTRPRIIGRHPASEEFEVVTVKGGEDRRFMPGPCAQCPWRADIPAGMFPAEAFRHSSNTAFDMAVHTFACHMAGAERPAMCAGFVLRGAAHNLTVRMLLIQGVLDLDKIQSDFPLYDDYRAMAEANGVDPDDPALQRCR